MFNQKIILASKSPRRQQLLLEAGIPFEVKTQDVPEDYPADLPVEEVAPYLARKKALGVKHFTQDGNIVLTADSVVILDGEIFEKPVDKADAVRMLSALSGTQHTVITGVCLLTETQERVFAGRSEVWLAPLSLQEIDYYIDQYQPFDKAGSYGIQEWIGHCKITKIEGTYPNIMGLPVNLVYEALVDLVGKKKILG